MATFQNQVGRQVVQGDLNVTYVGFEEYDKLRDQCLSDLFLVDPRDIRDDLKRKKGNRAAGTCEWFLNCDEITSWRDAASSDFNIFWLHGNAGTGKSMLALLVVDALEASFSVQVDRCVIYFFCDTSAHHQNASIAILRGLIYQLCKWSKYLLDEYLLPEYRTQRSKLFNSSAALWRIFRKMSMDHSCGHVYVVVDALDECDDDSQRQFLYYLEQSYGQKNQATENAAFRFLITSRPEQIIQMKLSKFRHRDLALYSEVEHDVDRLISETVSKLALKGYTSNMQREVTEIFKTKAECTFLWIGLAYTEIEELPVMHGLARLRGLPVGLNTMYQNLLRRALDKSERATGDRETIIKLLTTVAVALEPLTLEDLAIASSLFQTNDFKERVLFITETVKMCGFMIVIVDDHVRMLHKTVKDFIFKRAGDMFPSMLEVHARLASTCVDRLIDDYHTQQAIHTSQTNDSFVEYAVKHWASHAHLAQDRYAIKLPSQAEFFSHRSESRDAWLTYALALGEDISAYFSLFHVAARWDIMPLLKHTESEIFLNPHEDYVRVSVEDFVSGFETFRGNPLEVAASLTSPDIFKQLIRFRLKLSEDGARIVLHYKSGQEMDGNDVDDLKDCYRFEVTSQVMMMVVRNKKIASELLEILWNKRRADLKTDYNLVIDMIRFLVVDGSTVESTFRRLTTNTKVDRAILQAAAANEKSTKKLLGSLLDLRGEQSEIGREMLFAAAQQFDESIVQRILRYYDGELVLMTDLVTAVAMNRAHSHEIMSFLLQNISRSNIRPGQELTECVFEYFGPEIIQQLFDWKDVEVDERLMYASAKNISCSHEIFEKFAESSIREHVSERVLTAAANNSGSGQETLEFLLKLTEDKSMVTLGVLKRFSTKHPNIVNLSLQLIDCLLTHAKFGKDMFDFLWWDHAWVKKMKSDMFERIMTKLLVEQISRWDKDMDRAIDLVCECRTPLKYIEILLSEGGPLKGRH